MLKYVSPALPIIPHVSWQSTKYYIGYKYYLWAVIKSCTFWYLVRGRGGFLHVCIYNFLRRAYIYHLRQAAARELSSKKRQRRKNRVNISTGASRGLHFIVICRARTLPHLRPPQFYDNASLGLPDIAPILRNYKITDTTDSNPTFSNRNNASLLNIQLKWQSQSKKPASKHVNKGSKIFFRKHNR